MSTSELCTMHACLTYEPEAYPRLPCTSDAFIPRYADCTAKQRKLQTLQGTLGPALQPTETLPLPQPFYPLCKMLDPPPPSRVETGSREGEHDDTPRRLPEPPSPAALSAKTLKRAYDLHTRPLWADNTQLEENPHPAVPLDGMDIQDQYNRRLSELRGTQRNYSDVFGTRLDEKPIAARPNRALRDVRDEIFPSATKSGGNAAIYWMNRSKPEKDDETESSYAHVFGVKPPTPHRKMTEKDTSTGPSTADVDSAKTTDIFGFPISTANTSHPRVRVAMYRLETIPKRITQETLVAAIRRCHCYICKLWLPANILTGEHRGTCSLVARESTGADDATIDAPASPLHRLEAWFASEGITIRSSEVTFEE